MANKLEERDDNPKEDEAIKIESPQKVSTHYLLLAGNAFYLID